MVRAREDMCNLDLVKNVFSIFLSEFTDWNCPGQTSKTLNYMLLKLAHYAVNIVSLYFIADCRSTGMEHCVFR